MRLQNKVALITGASRGIGKASALALCREGAIIAGAARSRPDLDKLQAEIQALGGRSIPIETDVTLAPSVAACVARTIDELGRIDILVNNAGIGGYRPFLDWSEADYDRIMD